MESQTFIYNGRQFPIPRKVPRKNNNQLLWEEQDDHAFAELYQWLPNNLIEDLFGVGSKAIAKKASEMNVKKNILRLYDTKLISTIGNMWNDCSRREIARKLYVSERVVRTIAAELHLKNTPERCRNLKSAKMDAIIKKERLHAIFGLDSVTQIKVCINRSRAVIKRRMKNIGYIIDSSLNSIFYSNDIRRHSGLEKEAIKLGYKILPNESLL